MRLDHVGVAVKSVEAALPFYRDALGLAILHREEVPSRKVRVVFLGGRGPGEASVELIEAIDEDGAVAKFLKTRGPGLHHLAFKTGDIHGEMQRLRTRGTPPLETAGPRVGARGQLVCFLHPRHARGVLVELVG